MSTRSLTRIIDADYEYTSILLCVIYRHYDGYPEVHGAELKEFLKDIKVVNGLPIQSERTNLANGAGCLAAQLIAHLKDGPGQIYLDKPTFDASAAYTYTITVQSEHPIQLTVQRRDKLIYNGTINDFDPNIEELEV